MDNSINFKINLKVNGKDTLHNISIDAEDFKSAIKTSVEETQKLGGTLKQLTQDSVLFSGLKDTLDILNGAVGSLADSFDDFDEALLAANTMAGKDKAGFNALKKDIEGLARTIPLAKSELSKGLYQVISNGVPEDNWISYLEASAKSAVGGIADLGQTVTVTSTLIKNYGLEWDQAQEIQDKIQMTAVRGVTSFEQLSQALPRVAGNAATLGVSVDELMATFATLTGVSGNTAEVSTQLAAVFTALIKPSSEATEMAREMGVQFDAAAIKAAGGMNNFLSKLSIGIARYASATGMLEQEIYGKLFGSAESLRALIPLTGELSQKYRENVGAMADSTGSIAQAFDGMSSTGRNAQQRLNNMISTFFSFAGSVASVIKPYFSLLAGFGQGVYGVDMLIKYIKSLSAALSALSAAQIKHNIATKASAVATSTWKATQRACTTMMALYRLAHIKLTAAIGSATAATVALGAACTLGLSAAITGIVLLINKLINRSSSAAEAVDELKEAAEEFTSTTASAKADIDMEIASLANLMKSNADTAAAVEDLNSKYGAAFGVHQTAAEWYDILISKSDAYCRQLGYEAQARVIANKKAEKDLRLDEIATQKKTLEKTVVKTSFVDDKYKGRIEFKTYGNETEEYKQLVKEEKTLTAETEKLAAQFDDCWNKASDAKKEIESALLSTGNGNEAVSITAMSYEQLSAAIEKNASDLKKLAPTEKERIAALKAENAFLTAQKAEMANLLGLESKISGKSDDKYVHREIASLKDVTSLKEIDDEIAYQSELYKTAHADKVASIDKEIQRLNTLRTAFERYSHVSMPVDQITTYQQLNTELKYQQELLETATAAERAQIQQKIDSLNNLKSIWNAALIQAPAEISHLNTLESLSSAVSYYQQLQQQASADEYDALQRTINALEEKKRALEATSGIITFQDELDVLSSLNGRPLELKLELLGVEGIRQKIEELQKLLANPNLTDVQRNAIDGLIASWRGYQTTLEKSQVTFAGAWGQVKGLGNSIGSMTAAINGDSNAWQVLTAIVDGALSIMQSVTGIKQMITALTAADTAVTQANTTANIANAASKQFSVYSSLPFVGLALAIGGIAVIASKMSSLPKFANGGIAYGPTLGLFGEYAGAAHNPEVVAPLDRLRSMITPAASMDAGTVEFRIEGRTLVGVLSKEMTLRRRS